MRAHSEAKRKGISLSDLVVVIPIVALVCLELILVFHLHLTTTSLKVSLVVALILGLIMGIKTGISLSDRYQSKTLKEFTVETFKTDKKLYEKLSDKERKMAEIKKELAVSDYKKTYLVSKISELEKELVEKDQTISKILKGLFENSVALPGGASMLISETITKMVEVKVSKGSKAIGKKIRDLSLPHDCVIAAINRSGKLIVPRGDTVIKSGDIVALIGKENAIRKVIDILKGKVELSKFGLRAFLRKGGTLSQPS